MGILLINGGLQKSKSGSLCLAVYADCMIIVMREEEEMSGETSHSIVSLGDLSKPADTLIKKISAAVGGVFKPYQIRRVAKAEAEADLIRAQSKIQITELYQRAMHRIVEEEAKKQENIEQITSQALPLLKETSNPDGIEDDWITNFFDKCRIISDQEIQSLWSRVLSGEANAPGTYSKRTVNFLSDIDKRDAMLFSQLCGYAWEIGTLVPFIDDLQHEIYKKNGITFSTLIHLDTIGLITFSGVGEYQRVELGKRLRVSYYEEAVELEFPKDSDNAMNIGKVRLTQIGQELARICGSVPVDGFKQYVLEKWKAQGYIKGENSEEDAGSHLESRGR